MNFYEILENNGKKHFPNNFSKSLIFFKQNRFREFFFHQKVHAQTAQQWETLASHYELSFGHDEGLQQNKSWDYKTTPYDKPRLYSHPPRVPFNRNFGLIDRDINYE